MEMGAPGRWGKLLRWGNPPVHIICYFSIWSRLHDRWGDPPHVTSPIWGPLPPRKLNVFFLPCRIEGIIWLIRLLSLLNWNNRLLGDFFKLLSPTLATQTFSAACHISKSRFLACKNFFLAYLIRKIGSRILRTIIQLFHSFVYLLLFFRSC